MVENLITWNIANNINTSIFLSLRFECFLHLYCHIRYMLLEFLHEELRNVGWATRWESGVYEFLEGLGKAPAIRP
jgi:hypothetical protein